MAEPAWRVALVLGGARSGKSAHAERMVAARGERLIYVATAQAFDDEMRERIGVHRARRDERWTTIDAPVDLPGALRHNSQAGAPILVDCLTLWVTNLLLGDHDMDAAFAELEEALGLAAGPIVLVANETGLGIVPDNALARAFRDRAGQLNQLIAGLADRVDFVAAGLPLTLKG